MGDDEIVLAGLNLTYDFIKHITTLDTGLIVILATFLEKIFNNLRCKFCAILCIVSLCISLVGSLLFLHTLSKWMMYSTISEWPKSGLSWKISLSIYGFFGAFLFFTIFTLINLLSGEKRKDTSRI